MRTKVKMPNLGETAEELLVLEWAVAVGDAVTEGETLMTVETDKVEAVLPSPVSGTVVELLVEVDDEVPVGTPVCTVEI